MLPTRATNFSTYLIFTSVLRFCFSLGNSGFPKNQAVQSQMLHIPVIVSQSMLALKMGALESLSPQVFD